LPRAAFPQLSGAHGGIGGRDARVSHDDAARVRLWLRMEALTG